MRPRPLTLRALVVAVLVLPFTSCGDGRRGLTEPDQSHSVVVVSRPLPYPVPTTSSVRSAATPAGRDSVVYVSLAPGTVPGGVSVTIDNISASISETVPMVNGGLDPTPTPAQTGDTLVLVATDSSGGTHRLEPTVVALRPPAIVHTDPPSGGTDVPLNTQIVVVFSEPMDPRTATSQSVQLYQGGQPVAGVVTLSSDGLLGEFRPATSLKPLTDYTLVVSAGVADAGGLSLGQQVVATFTTGNGAGRIAFVGGFSGNAQIYTIAPDGTRLTQLTYDFVVPSGGPSWSADGSRIAFVRQGNIYTMNADGTDVVRLFASDTPAIWSPDRTRFVFDRCCDNQGYDQLFLVSTQGTGLVQLTNDARFHEFPAWSPDGSKIAYDAFAGLAAGQEFPDIYVINPDGTGLTDLTPDNPSQDMYPAWSPDGRKIAFASARSGGMQIFVMNADGTGVVNLTNDSGVADISPTWSPDGSRIAFMGHLGSNEEVFVMNADGSGIVSLVVGEDPRWGPP